MFLAVLYGLLETSWESTYRACRPSTSLSTRARHRRLGITALIAIVPRLPVLLRPCPVFSLRPESRLRRTVQPVTVYVVLPLPPLPPRNPRNPTPTLTLLLRLPREAAGGVDSRQTSALHGRRVPLAFSLQNLAVLLQDLTAGIPVQ